MKKKTVLFRYSSHQLDTGSPKALLATMSLLEGSGYEPKYLATGTGPLLDEMRKRHIDIIHDQVNEISVYSPVRALICIKYWYRKLKQLDVDILHMNEFGWNQDIVLAAKLRNIPVVLHCHNPTNISFSNLNRFAAKKVLTVSKKHAQDLTNFDSVKSKHDVLYNALDPGKFAFGESIRSQMGISEASFVVGSVAQICHRKGTDIFLDTAELLLRNGAHAHFLLVGPDGKGETEFAQDIHDRVSQPPLKGKVRLLGSRKDIPDLLATFDLFFLPTRAEPFGMVFTEALAAGLPVVASNVGGIPEIIESEELGLLVDSMDPESFCVAIETIMNRTDKGREMGAKGKESLLGRFDEAAVRQKLLSIYDSCF
jgi:glycosyltransferase involved in cell wall biosynthesis